MSNILSAKEIETGVHRVEYKDGMVLFVPADPRNSDFSEVEFWLSGDLMPTPDAFSTGEPE